MGTWMRTEIWSKLVRGMNSVQTACTRLSGLAIPIIVVALFAAGPTSAGAIPVPNSEVQDKAREVNTQLVWPENVMGKLAAFVMLAFLVIGIWQHYRPCDTCGEFREQCRCKGRDYEAP